MFPDNVSAQRAIVLIYYILVFFSTVKKHH